MPTPASSDACFQQHDMSLVSYAALLPAVSVIKQAFTTNSWSVALNVYFFSNHFDIIVV